MHPRVLAERTSKAQARVVKAVEVLAMRVEGVDQSLVGRLSQARHPDPKLKALFQMEAMADIMEAVVMGTESTPIDQLGADEIAQLQQAIQAVADQKNAGQPAEEAQAEEAQAEEAQPAPKKGKK